MSNESSGTIAVQHLGMQAGACPSRAQSGRHRPTWAHSGSNLAEAEAGYFGTRVQPNLGQSGCSGNLGEKGIGAGDASSTPGSTNIPERGLRRVLESKPILAQIVPLPVKLVQFWPNPGRTRSVDTGGKPAEFGPNVLKFGTKSTNVGKVCQEARICWPMSTDAGPISTTSSQMRLEIDKSVPEFDHIRPKRPEANQSWPDVDRHRPELDKIQPKRNEKHTRRAT